MTTTHRALLLGDLNWAKAAVDKLEQDFGLVHVPTGTRQGFIDDCKSGKYDGVEAILRHYHSAKEITGRLDRELIQALPSSVKYICSHASGYEIIDVPACTECNIAVANTPRVVDAATADMVLFLILGALRRAWIPQSSLRAGVWTKGVPFGHDPKDKVLGILGLGGVGIATAQRAVPFGFKLQYHNRRPVEGLEKHFAAENVPKFVSLDELLTTSDIVSLHLPLNESTRHCISTDQIAKMKDGVIIINTARGGVLDEKALIAALDSGKVWSAGLDVFEGEPVVLPELRSHPSVMMLPHLGTVTIETQVAMETLVVDNARAGLETGQLLTQVPEQCSPAKGLI